MNTILFALAAVSLAINLYLLQRLEQTQAELSGAHEAVDHLQRTQKVLAKLARKRRPMVFKGQLYMPTQAIKQGNRILIIPKQ